MICKGSHQSIKLTTSNFLNSLKCWAVTKSGVVNWNICSIIFSILIPIQWAFSSHPCAANCTSWTSGVNLLILKLTLLKHSHFIQHNYNLTFPLFSAMIHWTPSKCTGGSVYLCSPAYLFLSCEMCYFLWALISGVLSLAPRPAGATPFRRPFWWEKTEVRNNGKMMWNSQWLN